MTIPTSVVVAVVGAVGVISGAVIAQALNWTTLRQQRRSAKGRVQGLMRELTFLMDRAENEAEQQATIGIYRDRVDEAVTKLRDRLDSNESPLSEKAMAFAYAAVMACKEAIFASDNGFEQHLLTERIGIAAKCIGQAQEAMQDSDPKFIASA